MPTVTIHNGKSINEVTVEAGETLLSAIRKNNDGFIAPCGGMHRCGKCEVKAVGELSPVTDCEASFGIPSTKRLACFTQVEGDCSVFYNTDNNYDVLLDSSEATIFSASSSIHFGIAVDIGTTTIATSLYDLDTGMLINSLGEYNRQAQFGADVLSRIYYSMEKDANAPWEVIVSQLDSMLMMLCDNSNVDRSTVERIVITGNTVMLHFMNHLDARGIAASPFIPSSYFGNTAKGVLPHFCSSEVYYPPCVSAYIGADITCGLLSTGLPDMQGNVLFLDIGTNGEIILKANNALYSCSAAAGPAFEGAGITCGSGAVDGAISHISYSSENGFSYEVIGNCEPVSLCGSGLIDAISVMLDSGVINRKGNIRKEFGKSYTFPNTQVTLTQEDIRALQLAKASIRAGIDVLLKESNISYTDLDAMVLAGGFGVKMNASSAQRIGLLPDIGSKSILSVGNSSIAGAILLLTKPEKASEITSISSSIHHIELSLCESFYPCFVNSMSFN